MNGWIRTQLLALLIAAGLCAASALVAPSAIASLVAASGGVTAILTTDETGRLAGWFSDGGRATKSL